MPSVDAIVGSDVVAACAVREALSRGIRVPQDLQIIAYDGTYLADCAGRKLTVVKQDFDTLAEQLAGHIVDAINLAGDRDDGSDGGDGNTAKPADIDIVPVSLRIGDTTRSAA